MVVGRQAGARLRSTISAVGWRDSGLEVSMNRLLWLNRELLGKCDFLNNELSCIVGRGIPAGRLGVRCHDRPRRERSPRPRVVD